MALRYRLAQPGDLRLVVGAWVDSYRTAHAAGLVTMEDWASIMTEQVRKVLLREGVRIWVAHDPSEESDLVDLFGFIAVERGFRVPGRTWDGAGWRRELTEPDAPLVHYVFVKQHYRKEGIARGLFHAAGVDAEAVFFYTCKTGVVSKLAPKIPLARWNPLIARYPKTKP